MDQTTVVKALAKVIDPSSGQDIITRSMVRDLEIEGNNVRFTIELPNLNAQHKEELNFACIEAVQQAYPQAEVHVHLMGRTPESLQSNNPLAHVKNIIAVASGKGGVGKSTVSVNLALGLKKLGMNVGLVDADLYGPSIPTMLGLQGQRPKIQTLYGQPKIQPLEAYGMPVMSIGFIIEPEQAVVLRGPRLAGIIKQFFNDTIWPELDCLVVDLPPGTGDIQLSLVQTVPVTGVVLVTTPQEVAIADAVKAMNMFLLPSVNVPILGVVENMAWFTPAELPNNKYYIFGQGGGKKMVQLSESMLLGQVPIVMSIRESGDAGKPAILGQEESAKQAFAKVAENTLRQLAIRNEMLEPTKMVGLQS
ncbi:MAG TPA: Mrp/NBP35 family ATP-binding protein [Saprospiraceae bacterium]|nr:Mrp/NBP35 family ATP-binding protein [Saprospiraceae bacterium]HMQ83283.1 Mrp/NBP35 family ATP-binding protein [Saprospiraceae bacterium]